MYACMYACMHVCMYVYVHVYGYVWLYVYGYVPRSIVDLSLSLNIRELSNYNHLLVDNN